ncbi:MAG: CerR family C-terminal domain-containing protein [Rhizobiaceae bacterium]|nr:CerR family C-terminal domain-containing protein [Rhizobiaceae bacterium]
MARNPISPSKARRPLASADETRLALIRAALKLFGAQGFDATSTREIAARANANVASITYHFGGKEGLRAAAAEQIVLTLRTNEGALLAESLDPRTLSADEAEGHLVSVFDAMASFLLATPEAEDIALFILRELAQPTAALDIIYEGMFRPTHERMCQLWAAATGEGPDSEATKVTLLTLIGQVVYFKFGRAAVLRRMGWSSIDEDKAGLISGTVRANVRAIVASRRKPVPTA